jgi:hypothetical protein
MARNAAKAAKRNHGWRGDERKPRNGTADGAECHDRHGVVAGRDPPAMNINAIPSIPSRFVPTHRSRQAPQGYPAQRVYGGAAAQGAQ